VPLATTPASANNNAPSPVIAENASFVASGPPRPLQAAFTAPSSEDEAAELALMSSMNAKGFDSELSQRALAAYSKSLASAPLDSIPAF
jgi:hypothetical protein